MSHVMYVPGYVPGRSNALGGILVRSTRGAGRHPCPMLGCPCRRGGARAFQRPRQCISFGTVWVRVIARAVYELDWLRSKLGSQ